MLEKHHLDTLTRALARLDALQQGLPAAAKTEHDLFMKSAREALREVRYVRVCKVCKGTGRVITKPFKGDVGERECYNCQPMKR